MRPHVRPYAHHRVLLLAVVVPVLVTACGQQPAPDGDAPPETPAASSPAAMLDDLDEDYGCGHGFYASDAEQTRALFVIASDPQASEDELGIPGEVVLPDDAWQAYVETGEHLFANWCDDVVMPEDPEPVTDESFTITGGTMTVTPAGPDGFRAELTDIQVESADGATIELGDVTTTNDLWGVYAG